MNDVNRLRILQDVIDRRITTRLAATRLEISDRHYRRLLELYREHGPLSLVNRRMASLATGNSCRASLNEHYVLSAKATLRLLDTLFVIQPYVLVQEADKF